MNDALRHANSTIKMLAKAPCFLRMSLLDCQQIPSTHMLTKHIQHGNRYKGQDGNSNGQSREINNNGIVLIFIPDVPSDTQ